MTYIPLEAELALEWWRAAGERTPERLTMLVEWYLDTREVTDAQQRATTIAAAFAARYPWEVAPRATSSPAIRPQSLVREGYEAAWREKQRLR